MKKTGIWLDKEKALIVDLINNKATLKVVPSNIENYHVYGGSGTRLKGGPQDVVQDSRYLEREKHQFRAYFKAIVSELNNAKEIVVFGPAETKQKFSKELALNYKRIYDRLLAVETADSMTDNQVKAWVRSYFLKDSSLLKSDLN